MSESAAAGQDRRGPEPTAEEPSSGSPARTRSAASPPRPTPPTAGPPRAVAGTHVLVAGCGRGHGAADPARGGREDRRRRRSRPAIGRDRHPPLRRADPLHRGRDPGAAARLGQLRRGRLRRRRRPRSSTPRRRSPSSAGCSPRAGCCSSRCRSPSPPPGAADRNGARRRRARLARRGARVPLREQRRLPAAARDRRDGRPGRRHRAGRARRGGAGSPAARPRTGRSCSPPPTPSCPSSRSLASMVSFRDLRSQQETLEALGGAGAPRRGRRLGQALGAGRLARGPAPAADAPAPDRAPAAPGALAGAPRQAREARPRPAPARLGVRPEHWDCGRQLGARSKGTQMSDVAVVDARSAPLREPLLACCSPRLRSRTPRLAARPSFAGTGMQPGFGWKARDYGLRGCETAGTKLRIGHAKRWVGT